ncbi:MAG: helix-turn-helix domain-containing protein [Spirochaetes bacterium]|jgi:AraC-like DNA-binding protein|nr:helix-turn-helix domain-containing protein [Spirochaetota bacterium]
MAVELPSPAFRMFKPAPDLARYVKVMYLIETPYVGIEQFIPAWNKPLLVLQYHDPVYSTINGVPEPVESISVSGITSKKYGFYTPAPEIRLFMVDLTPIGLYTLFHERADLLSDLSADATPLIPSRQRRLICEALAEIDDVQRKAHIVEEFLRSLIPDRPPRWVEEVLVATELIRRADYRGRIDEIIDYLGMSPRTFRRAFREITGVGAKTFQRIGRFERVFDRFMGRDPGDWAHAVFDETFYDQAHFIHDFKAFTGYAPRDLPKENFYMYHILTQPGFGE